MAVQVIPIDSTPSDYTLRAKLDGRFYTLRFKWNTRWARWSMDMLNETGEALVLGMRLVHGYNILRAHSQAAMPGGAIVAVDATGQQQDPGKLSLGGDVSVCYVPAAEVVVP